MISALDLELHRYIDQLNAAQKRSLLGFLTTIFSNEGQTSSIDQYNKELREAEDEIAGGEFYTNDEAMQILKGALNGSK